MNNNKITSWTLPKAATALFAALTPRNPPEPTLSSSSRISTGFSLFFLLQDLKGKKTLPTVEYSSSSSVSNVEIKEADALVPQISQLLLRYEFRKVQALQDHLGFDEDDNEEEDGENDDNGGWVWFCVCVDWQIWQVDFSDGELRNVQFKQVQEAIDVCGKVRVLNFVRFCSWKRNRRADDDVIIILWKNAILNPQVWVRLGGDLVRYGPPAD